MLLAVGCYLKAPFLKTQTFIHIRREENFSTFSHKNSHLKKRKRKTKTIILKKSFFIQQNTCYYVTSDGNFILKLFSFSFSLFLSFFDHFHFHFSNLKMESWEHYLVFIAGFYIEGFLCTR